MTRTAARLSLGVLGVIIIGSAVAAPARSGGAAPLSCYERAKNDTMMSGLDASRLCEGSSSEAPVSCFEEAKDKTMLSDNQAISLCRCAPSAAPVACFERAKSDTLASDHRSIMLCSPSMRGALGSDCRAVRRVPYGLPRR